MHNVIASTSPKPSVIVRWLNVIRRCGADGVLQLQKRTVYNAVIIISRRARNVKCNFPRAISCVQFFYYYLHEKKRKETKCVYNVVISRNARNEKCSNFLCVKRLRSRMHFFIAWGNFPFLEFASLRFLGQATSLKIQN